MSSRRNLKKEISESMGLLHNDCVLYKIFYKNANLEKADKIISEIADVHADLLSRVSISEGKEVRSRVRAYYKKLRDDLKMQVNKFGLEIEKLD